jgi:hypothetical protein
MAAINRSRLPRRGQAKTATPNKKTTRRRSLCSLKGAGDQAMRNDAPFGFRRYAMKPSPQKPKIIIAQVEASGTAAT